MIIEYLSFLSYNSLILFFLQTFIIYNVIKIIQNNNTYYILAYFFLYILFSGILIIFIECELITILL